MRSSIIIYFLATKKAILGLQTESIQQESWKRQDRWTRILSNSYTDSSFMSCSSTHLQSDKRLFTSSDELKGYTIYRCNVCGKKKCRSRAIRDNSSRASAHSIRGRRTPVVVQGPAWRQEKRGRLASLTSRLKLSTGMKSRETTIQLERRDLWTNEILRRGIACLWTDWC